MGVYELSPRVSTDGEGDCEKGDRPNFNKVPQQI